jgi:hypothetical protein
MKLHDFFGIVYVYAALSLGYLAVHLWLLIQAKRRERKAQQAEYRKHAVQVELIKRLNDITDVDVHGPGVITVSGYIDQLRML